MCQPFRMVSPEAMYQRPIPSVTANFMSAPITMAQMRTVPKFVPATSEEIMSLFEALHQEGQTIVLVTHEHDIATHARRQVHLKDGKVERDFETVGQKP